MIGNISHHLIYYTNVDEARDAFRLDASKLIGSTSQIPNYMLLQQYGWWIFGKLPTLTGIRDANRELIGISNIEEPPGPAGLIRFSTSRKKIRKILCIKDQ